MTNRELSIFNLGVEAGLKLSKYNEVNIGMDISIVENNIINKKNKSRKKTKYKKWSEYEISLLKNISLNSSYISKIIGRTTGSILAKRWSLGIKTSKKDNVEKSKIAKLNQL